MTPQLIAHRGDSINFPENTIEAFRSAFDKGAQGIEFDVHVNDNNQAIVVHSYLYDKNKNYPFLETVLEKFSQKGFLEIEIKSFSLDQLEIIINLIKKFNPPNYTITSSILPLLAYVRQKVPLAIIGAIIKPYFFELWMTVEFINQFVSGVMKLTTANVVQLYPQQYLKSLIDILKKQGFITHGHIYTDKIEEFKKIRKLGVDRCTFDNINLLSKMKLHGLKPVVSSPL